MVRKPPAACLLTHRGLSEATMKSFLLLFCLAQLCSCRSIPLDPIAGYKEPACDDPDTEQAALAAVDYINKHLPRGYKHTLNQIDSVKVWPRVSEPALPGGAGCRGRLSWVSLRACLPEQRKLHNENALIPPRREGEGRLKEERRHSVLWSGSPGGCWMGAGSVRRGRGFKWYFEGHK